MQFFANYDRLKVPVWRNACCLLSEENSSDSPDRLLCLQKGLIMSRTVTYQINYPFLKQLLRKKGFTRGGGNDTLPYNEFAILCGISPGYLSQLLKGDREPSMTVLKRMALHLGISIDALMAPDEELLRHGLSHVINRWVVTQMDPETTEEIDAKTALEILRFLNKTFDESAETDEAEDGDASVFTPPELSDSSESETP